MRGSEPSTRQLPATLTLTFPLSLQGRGAPRARLIPLTQPYKLTIDWHFRLRHSNRLCLAPKPLLALSSLTCERNVGPPA